MSDQPATEPSIEHLLSLIVEHTRKTREYAGWTTFFVMLILAGLALILFGAVELKIDFQG